MGRAHCNYCDPCNSSFKEEPIYRFLFKTGERKMYMKMMGGRLQSKITSKVEDRNIHGAL